MNVSILTLFPEMFTGPLTESIIKRAVSKQCVTIEIVNIRDFATDPHKSVDDKPYSGGQGMILRIDVLHRCLTHVQNTSHIKRDKTHIILTDPKGDMYTQRLAQRFADTVDHLIIICGHYEGVDDRIRYYIDQSVSVGPFVLTGGEIPAMTIADSVIRLIPGVLANPNATKDESFSEDQTYEYPQYTRPPVYDGHEVPAVLLSGNPKKISEWKKSALLK